MDRPQGATLCMLEAYLSIDHRAITTIVLRAMMVEDAPSPQKTFCKYCKKKSHMIEDCWKLQNKEKRKNKSDGKASVASAGDNSDQIAWLSLLVVLLVMMSGYLIMHVLFISALTEIGLVPMSLCRMVISCIWEMITRVRLWVLALFRSRPMMA